MSPENPFLKPPAVDERSPDWIELINAVSTLLDNQRRFDRETVTKFKRLFDDSGLKKWIVLAGIGGVAAIIATVIEAIRGVVDIWTHYHP